MHTNLLKSVNVFTTKILYLIIIIQYIYHHISFVCCVEFSKKEMPVKVDMNVLVGTSNAICCT